MTQPQAAAKPHPRVLSGIRPTGPLHVGHLVGALENWVALQAKYECFFMIADWHALTSHFEDPARLREYSLENLACALAAGVDPARAVLFRQSDVPEHAELHLLLSMVTPVPWLERVPTYKEQKEQVTDHDLSSYGFLGYPVLQTADIAAYKATLVPVGEDQVAHLELGREVIRRFNKFYGPVLPEPQPMLTAFPRLPGADRRKMSKSYGNSIELGADRKAVEKQVKAMYTDPVKIHLGDRGHPDGCVVYEFHRTFNAAASPQVKTTCEDGSRGCGGCKQELLAALWARMEPVMAARSGWLADPRKLEDILAAGAARARAIAGATLAEVRSAMKIR